MAQWCKNPPEMPETCLILLLPEDPLESKWQLPSILALGNLMDCEEACRLRFIGLQRADTTE